MNRDALHALAILRLILGVIAAIVLFVAGHHMRQEASISGDTVAESFDHDMGLLSYGLGFAALMASIPMSYIKTESELATDIALTQEEVRTELDDEDPV